MGMDFTVRVLDMRLTVSLHRCRRGVPWPINRFGVVAPRSNPALAVGCPTIR